MNILIAFCWCNLKGEKRMKTEKQNTRESLKSNIVEILKKDHVLIVPFGEDSSLYVRDVCSNLSQKELMNFYIQGPRNAITFSTVKKTDELRREPGFDGRNWRDLISLFVVEEEGSIACYGNMANPNGRLKSMEQAIDEIIQHAFESVGFYNLVEQNPMYQ
jgi:hypothetical protein